MLSLPTPTLRTSPHVPRTGVFFYFFIGVTLGNKIVWVSSVQFKNTSYVYCTVRSPPKDKFPSVTRYLTAWTPPTSPLRSLWSPLGTGFLSPSLSGGLVNSASPHDTEQVALSPSEPRLPHLRNGVGTALSRGGSRED